METLICCSASTVHASSSLGDLFIERCRSLVLRSGARHSRVLDRRKSDSLNPRLVIKINPSYTSACKCLPPWPSPNFPPERSSRFKISHRRKFIQHDFQRRARSPFEIFCDEGGDFGGDYFSSGEQNSYSDGDYFSSGEQYSYSDGDSGGDCFSSGEQYSYTDGDSGTDCFSSGEQNSYSDEESSPGGSPRSGYTSGSASESDQVDFFDESAQNELKRSDLAAPLLTSRHAFATKIGQGILATAVLSMVLLGTVLIIDSYIWRVIRRPLAHFFLTGPFCVAAATTAVMGCISVPLLKRLKTYQVFRIEGPGAHRSKIGTPTMGGMYFVPVGVGVARMATGFWTPELWGVCVATLAFAAIGFADDWLAQWRKHNYGMPGSLKFLLQVAVGVWFVFGSTAPAYNLRIKCVVTSSPGSRLLPLPAPFGLRYLGKWCLPLTAFCFAAMSNGVNLTDGLDGLAAGTCAVAYIGMAVAVLPIYPGLGIFGASMAGACIGFLTQNRYKARVFMGDTGSLALGGGLAAMAACTGMFLPLFIASGVFILETLSVIIQVSFFKVTRRLEGKGRRLFLMSPFHHHLELIGWNEPIIVAAAYVVAYILAIAAAHVGLISA